MAEDLPAKECPKCGNLDYNDGFTIIKCSSCGNQYMAYLGKDNQL